MNDSRRELNRSTDPHVRAFKAPIAIDDISRGIGSPLRDQANTSGFPELENIFRKTGEVCLERTMRIMQRSKGSLHDSPDKQFGASDSHMQGTFLQQKRNDKLYLLRDI